MSKLIIVAGVSLFCTLTPAFANPSLLLEAASEDRRRGISWSDGDPVVRASASIPVTSALSLDGTATSLSGSNRHGGADAVIDIGPALTHRTGAWSIRGSGTWHFFPGASDQGYGEAGVDVGFLIGPANAEIFTRYAPSQSNIGGDSLYLGTALSLAIPTTPLTLSAHIGRSSGSDNGSLRSLRLRPDGTYWDHSIGLDYYRGRLNIGLRYSDSSITQDATPATRHSGAALIAKVGLSL